MIVPNDGATATALQNDKLTLLCQRATFCTSARYPSKCALLHRLRYSGKPFCGKSRTDAMGKRRRDIILQYPTTGLCTCTFCRRAIPENARRYTACAHNLSDGSFFCPCDKFNVRKTKSATSVNVKYYKTQTLSSQQQKRTVSCLLLQTATICDTIATTKQGGTK